MPNTWSAKSSNSIALFDAVFERKEGLLWLMGGRGSDGDPSTEVRNRRYDPDTNTWEALGTIANMPAAVHRGNHKGWIGDKLYRIGGNNSTATTMRVLEYDLASDSWTELASESASLIMNSISGAVLNGIVYMVGGTMFKSFEPGVGWTTLTARPNNLINPGVVGFRGRLHCIGGYSVSGGSAQAHHDIYEPGVGWSSGTALPAARRNLATCVAGDSWLFAGGGGSGSGTPESGFWVYNPATTSWTAKQSLPSVDAGLDARMEVIDQQVWAYDFQTQDLHAWDPDIAMPSEGVVTEGWGMLV